MKTGDHCTLTGFNQNLEITEMTYDTVRMVPVSPGEIIGTLSLPLAGFLKCATPANAPAKLRGTQASIIILDDWDAFPEKS